MSAKKSRLPSVIGAALIAAGLAAGTTIAADHGDTPNLIGIPRHDARISDLFVFTHEDNLVLVLGTFPNLPGMSYQFPADLTLRFHIDNHSKVSFDNQVDNAHFGGTIVRPRNIGADIVLEFTFDDMGAPILNASGLSDSQAQDIEIFAGMRDDPFIRGPQIGRNVAALVVEFPLAYALGGGGADSHSGACSRGAQKQGRCDDQSSDDVILVWATSKVPDITGPQADLAALALRSQCGQMICNAVDGPDLNLRNQTPPQKYARVLGLRPDVVIFDTTRPAGFPNGRVLTDDVVDIVAPFGQNILGNDFPCPSANDVPFLNDFPYLAPPQFGAPSPPAGPPCS